MQNISTASERATIDGDPKEEVAAAIVPPARAPPPTWAVGSTLEYEFGFPVLTHGLYGPAKRAESATAHASTGRPAEFEPAAKSKRAATQISEVARLMPVELKDKARANRVAVRQRRKTLDICRDCQNLAVSK